MEITIHRRCEPDPEGRDEVADAATAAIRFR
jgi:hypothetical protein